MSVQPEGLVDPRDAFLDRPIAAPVSGVVPFAASAAAEEAAITGISILIGAAVVSGFVLVRRELHKEHPSTGAEAKKSAHKAWQRILPSWLKIALPAITQAYSLGSTGNLNYNELEILATDYATDLGEYVNKTSADALMEGFAAQVNAGWSDILAWERAKEAYGLDARQMRSYISGLMAQDPKSYVTDPIPAASRALINQAVSVRAERIGVNEAYKSSQVGRNMVWLTMAAQGDIPEGTRKKWVTAEDERVCDVCGPLDQRVIPLHWKFKANTGERFYAPGVHPNCRCHLEIVYPELGNDVIKAMPGDPYDRAKDGRFAATEQRSAMDVLREREKPQAKTDTSNPLAILREPKSEALRYVGSNPVARAGALEVLRASKQTASPMAVLAEAKKEEEKKSSPAATLAQKPEEAKAKEETPQEEKTNYVNEVMWINATPILRELDGSSPEEFMDPDWADEGRVLRFSKQKIKVGGYTTGDSSSASVFQDMETNAFTKAFDEAVSINADKTGTLRLKNADGEMFSIPEALFNGEDTTRFSDDMVFFRVKEWKKSDQKPGTRPPWIEQHDSLIDGDYRVIKVQHIPVPGDVLAFDEQNQKAWVITLVPYEKVG